MYYYRAFNLGIQSEIFLPGLPAANCALPDVLVRVGDIDPKATPPQCDDVSTFLGYTSGVATYKVRNGTEIIVNPAEGAERSLVSAILLGPILSILLRQRGLAVIHASGVVRRDGVIAFIGDSGYGKSTLAKAFDNRGASVITDDVMAIRTDLEATPNVLPGYPSLRLRPDAADFLKPSSSAAPKAHSRTDKLPHFVTSRFPQCCFPLRRMYMLARGEKNEIQPLGRQQTFVELVRNTRAIALMRDRDSRKLNFQHCAKIAAGVPGFRLQRRSDLNDLDAIVDLIEKDVAAAK